MPTFSPVTIANSAAANVTFNPSEKTGNGTVFTYVDSNADPRLRRKITMSRQPSSGTSMERVKARIIIPYTSVDYNSVTKIDQAVITLEVMLPPSVSLTSRRDLVAFAKNLLATSLVDEVAGQGFGIY